MPKARGDVFVVVMAGGSGTRFWPLSRRARPKQFLALATRQPLIAETVSRLRSLKGLRETLVVCGPRHVVQVHRTVPSLPKGNVIVEPVARNTAPAIALATAHVARRDPKAVVVVVPSDQHVANERRFVKALDEAVAIARRGGIVTLGIEPTRPETGFGYIRLGTPASRTARRVAAFVEKPNQKTAERYLKSGGYLWNAGIFVFRADVMLSALATHLPELSTRLDRIRAALGTRRERATLTREFSRLEPVSIDTGVAEKAVGLVVVPCRCGWSDVGSFSALPEVRAADADGNVVVGDGAVLIDVKGCVVVAQGRPVAVVGLRDTVVIDAGDAVLVAPLSRSQDVKRVVETLAKRRLDRYL